MFLTFLRSRGGSFRALMSAAADGTTSTLACRFCTMSLHVTRKPFHSPEVAFTISSPTFLGDMPSGPTLGASDDAPGTSPPVTRTYTYLTSLGSILGGILEDAEGKRKFQ